MKNKKKKKKYWFYRDGPGLPWEDSGVLNIVSLRIWTINGRIACTKRVQRATGDNITAAAAALGKEALAIATGYGMTSTGTGLVKELRFLMAGFIFFLGDWWSLNFFYGENCGEGR
jgi:hypothetical protein